MAPQTIPFVKMQGIGNDFIVIDCLADHTESRDWATLAVAMNDRRFGIGGDGLILVLRGEQAPFQMRMFNPDGSESEMCGNGIRCFAKFLRNRGVFSGSAVQVETGAGILSLRFADEDQVQVDMGESRLSRTSIGIVPSSDDPFIEQPIQGYLGTAVSMGNPHLVIFVRDVAAVDLTTVGPELEKDPMFSNRINVHFAEVVSDSHVIQRTWERGAGITLACGTGACAVAVAGSLTGRTTRNVKIDLPGGRLEIEVLPDNRVLMTGPAETVFTGDYFVEADNPPLATDCVLA